MGATKLMIIRHAEKPDSYAGRQYYGVDEAGGLSGDKGAKHLVTLGWERAGALVTLFAPPWGPKAPALATPKHLFASDPEIRDEAGPSQRPYETLIALSAALQLKIDTSYKRDHYDKMVAAALACDGPVLISWQHENIPLQNKDGAPGISQCILTATNTPAGRFAIPAAWPKGKAGARYDLVFVFDRPTGSGPIEGFSLFAQRLLAGDEAAP